MPFDYPGEFQMRFDGVDVGRFRELVVIPRGGQPMRYNAVLTTAGPGTIELNHPSGVNASGDLLLHRWQKSSVPTGSPSNIVIVVLNTSGSPISKWLLRNARPGKSLMKAAGAVPSTTGAVRAESVTIVHEGMQRIH